MIEELIETLNATVLQEIKEILINRKEKIIKGQELLKVTLLAMRKSADDLERTLKENE